MPSRLLMITNPLPATAEPPGPQAVKQDIGPQIWWELTVRSYMPLGTWMGLTLGVVSASTP